MECNESISLCINVFQKGVFIFRFLSVVGHILIERNIAPGCVRVCVIMWNVMNLFHLQVHLHALICVFQKGVFTFQFLSVVGHILS